MHLHHCEKLVEIFFYINLLVVNLTTCVYHIVIDKSLHNLFYILQLYIIDVLGILLNLRYCIAHILYVWNFSHCTAAPFMLMNGKYKQGDYNNTTFFTGVLQRYSERTFKIFLVLRIIIFIWSCSMIGYMIFAY